MSENALNENPADETNKTNTTSAQNTKSYEEEIAEDDRV